MAKAKIEYIRCSKCGKEMPKGSAFCSSCGAKIEDPKIEYITCKHCGNLTPKGSIFCMHCGDRIVRKTRESEKEIGVPDPIKLPSGKWRIQLRKEKANIMADTAEECKAKARAIRAGFMKEDKKEKPLPLKACLEKYIADNEAVLSPATVRNYESIKENRFKKYWDSDIRTIEWQAAISEEAQKKAPKTVHNAWRLITPTLEYFNVPVPKVKLPQKVASETEWLDYEDIMVFLEKIKGKSCELTCLLALHSLRISEIRALEQSSIRDGILYVRGAVVPNKENKMVHKKTNKTAKSTRDIPVMIPRLLEIWPKEGETLKLQGASPLRRMIERVCRDNNLPNITIHGLRHSFASLAYHLKWDVRTTCCIGGWSTTTCVDRIYTHLSKKDKDINIEKMKEFYRGSAKTDQEE